MARWSWRNIISTGYGIPLGFTEGISANTTTYGLA